MLPLYLHVNKKSNDDDDDIKVLKALSVSSYKMALFFSAKIIDIFVLHENLSYETH